MSDFKLAPEQPAPRPVPRSFKITAVTVAALIGLVFGEVALRMLPQDFVRDRDLLEGDSLLAIPPSNPDPRRDFPDVVKPEGVYRIVVLGDSQTVSGEMRNTYAEVLERLLHDGGGLAKRVEVHNAGAPGHAPYQYYLALDRRMKQYEPDLVIVAPYIGNDFLDLLRDDDRPSLVEEGGQLIHKPPVFYKFYDPEQTGRGVLESLRTLQLVRTTFRRTLGYKADRARIMLQVGYLGGRGTFEAVKFLQAVVKGSFVHEAIFRQSINQVLFLERFPEAETRMDRINEHLLTQMKALAQQHAFKLLYVPLPTKLQVDPDPAVLDPTLAASGLEHDSLQIEDRLYTSLTARLDAHGIPYVAVRGALERVAKQAALFDETYHLTDEGNAVVAEELAKAVRPLIGSETAAKQGAAEPGGS